MTTDDNCHLSCTNIYCMYVIESGLKSLVCMCAFYNEYNMLDKSQSYCVCFACLCACVPKSVCNSLSASWELTYCCYWSLALKSTQKPGYWWQADQGSQGVLITHTHTLNNALDAHINRSKTRIYNVTVQTRSNWP